MKRGAGMVPEHLKLLKEEVGYHPAIPRGLRPPKGCGVRCGTCRLGYHARGSDIGGCMVVEGVINVHGWCPLWTADGTIEMDWFSGRELSLMMKRLEPFLKRIFRPRSP